MMTVPNYLAQRFETLRDAYTFDKWAYMDREWYQTFDTFQNNVVPLLLKYINDFNALAFECIERQDDITAKRCLRKVDALTAEMIHLYSREEA